MPALPTAPSLLTSSLVGLGGLLIVVVAVSGGCYLRSRIAKSLAERRRARTTDAENAGNASSATVEGKSAATKTEPPLAVLVAARKSLHAQQQKAAATTYRVALHKALMADHAAKPVYTVNAPVVLASSPGARILLRLQGKQHTAGRVVTRRTWSHPGPSPLRSSITAPQPGAEHVPAPLVVVSTVVAPIHILAPAPVVFVKKPPIALTRDSSSDYTDSDDDLDEPIIPSPIPTQPRVFLDSRRGNLRCAMNIKRALAKTSTPQLPPGKFLENGRGKRLSVRVRKEKENRI
ncbi:hypothetical protein FB451DRAFT_1171880 [Mycena latifolia]|nr:hypothetical protein FB451DRAFT_1171880 [Mycena latifolia]